MSSRSPLWAGTHGLRSRATVFLPNIQKRSRMSQTSALTRACVGSVCVAEPNAAHMLTRNHRHRIYALLNPRVSSWIKPGVVTDQQNNVFKASLAENIMTEDAAWCEASLCSGWMNFLKPSLIFVTFCLPGVRCDASSVNTKSFEERLQRRLG